METIKENVILIIIFAIILIVTLFIIINMIITQAFTPYIYEDTEIHILHIENVQNKCRVIYIKDGKYENMLTKNIYETKDQSYVRKKYKYNKLLGESNTEYEIHINENILRNISYDIE